MLCTIKLLMLPLNRGQFVVAVAVAHQSTVVAVGRRSSVSLVHRLLVYCRCAREHRQRLSCASPAPALSFVALETAAGRVAEEEKLGYTDDHDPSRLWFSLPAVLVELELLLFLVTTSTLLDYLSVKQISASLRLCPATGFDLRGLPLAFGNYWMPETSQLENI
ncbi:hypothetical protein GmHk_01G000633 [Glycine max]|nr:hypothetical protein GmHk_01G000633 [Glycine max]